MEQQKSDNHWIIMGLLAVGFVALGYMAFLKQKSRPSNCSNAPVSVAAVRGNEAGVDVSASNAAVDYVKNLQDDVELARRNTRIYQDAQNARMKDVGGSAGE